MDVNKIINRERKLLRTIKHHLPSLLNHKNYIVPTNIDELKEVVFKKPYIKVNNTDLYLNDKITKILLEIPNLFQTTLTLQKTHHPEFNATAQIPQ